MVTNKHATKDILYFSGIRPVRKFPENFPLPTAQPSQSSDVTSDTSKCEMPSRMSAMVKSNPVSLAQQEKMMRRSGPAIQRFQLSRVREVTGAGHEGWFSSKLLTMKYLADKSNNNTDVKLNTKTNHQHDLENWFSSWNSKVTNS